MKSFLKEKNNIDQTAFCGSVPTEFAERLLPYDVVSFDIFDTLIFRPFDNPDDLFFHMAKEIGSNTFAKARIKAEDKARKNGEVTLHDIYENMKLDAENRDSLMKLEQKSEIKLCYANPYMLDVFAELIRNKKKIIIISDMYLSYSVILKILEKCGYYGYSELFVSCEYGVSKHSGELYEIARQKLGDKLSYIHIGDNEYSDIIQAKKHGFEAIHYKKI